MNAPINCWIYGDGIRELNLIPKNRLSGHFNKLEDFGGGAEVG